jgi:FOG: WD40 repeat
LAFTADGSRLLAAGDNHVPNDQECQGAVRLFDVATGRKSWERLLPQSGFVAKFSPDEAQIVVSSTSFESRSPGSLYWLDARSGQIVKEDRSKGDIDSIAWPDGSRLSVARGGTVYHLDAARGGETAKVDIRVLQRDPTTGTEFRNAKRVVLFPIGKGAVTIAYRTPQLFCWDTLTGRQEWSVALPGTMDMALAVSPDRRLVATLSGVGYGKITQLCLWNLVTGEKVQQLESGVERSQYIGFVGDERVLVGFADGTSLVYDVSAARNKVE